MQNIAASTSTNSADWHVGVLRIVNTPAPEDWYFSGVYIENGPINTVVGTGGGGVTTTPPASSTPTTTPPVSTTTAGPAGPAQTQWGQCGGTQALLSRVNLNVDRTDHHRKRIHWTYIMCQSLYMHRCLATLLLPSTLS